MKIAAAKAAVESAAGKTGDGRGAGVNAGQRMNAASAKLTKPRTTAKSRSADAQTGGRDANA
jgi:hypothetical protein